MIVYCFALIYCLTRTTFIKFIYLFIPIIRNDNLFINCIILIFSLFVIKGFCQLHLIIIINNFYLGGFVKFGRVIKIRWHLRLIQHVSDSKRIRLPQTKMKIWWNFTNEWLIWINKWKHMLCITQSNVTFTPICTYKQL